MHIHTSDQPALHLGFGNYTCNWGVHAAALYEKTSDRDEILFGFLAQGLRDSDCILYGCHDRTPEEFSRTFLSRFPDLAHAFSDASRVSIRQAKEAYCQTGTFSSDDIMATLECYYRGCGQEGGGRAVRASGEMNWASDDIPGIEQLMTYEARLTEFIAGKPWVSICLYDITQFSGATIMNVLRTHPFIVSNGVVVENPYFMEPRTWLARYGVTAADQTNASGDR
jgi:hypothetical protein